MDWRFVALMLAGISLVFAYKTIIRDIKSGITPFVIASWIVWVAEDVLLTAGDVAKHVELSSILLPVVWTIGSSVILIIFSKEKFTGFGSLDKLCLFLGALGLGAWLVTAVNGNAMPELGLAGAILALTAACVPTFKEEFLTPGPAKAWLLFVAGSVFDLLAVKQWDFYNTLVPVVGIVLQVGIVLSVLGGRIRRNRLTT